ncbi:synaptonemal complex central element protein 1 isoform X2 [Alligator sinensis]|uniref:Synaptonemal complex central element protein 1 isoform X2 n=1 Tax=Alligator sinensis TaxID=38654 RepID=A0A1U8DW85_ALLSI|nr:synaptonemal complex central element protein 1 isoform X2 [Alligator sinensis]
MPCVLCMGMDKPTPPCPSSHFSVEQVEATEGCYGPPASQSHPVGFFLFPLLKDLGPKAEELLLLVKQLQKAGDLEPRIEDLVSRINKLQQVTKEQTNLEDIHWQKEEALRVVQVQCQEAESESHRQHGLLQEVQQRIQDLTMGIQEETLKQRKQRLEFEQQLDELMEKHKTLQEGHTMDKLAVEIQNMSDSWERLLREDELIQAKLMQLKQKLDVLAQAGAGRREERRFLKSPEASAALQLLQQENQGAHSQLEVATQRHCQGLQRCNRWHPGTRRWLRDTRMAPYVGVNPYVWAFVLPPAWYQ